MKEQPALPDAVPAPWSGGGWQSLLPFLKTEKGAAVLLLLVAIVFNAVFLWPEAGVPAFSFNDESVHLTAAQQASAVLGEGRNPTDFWLTQIELGLPLFHYYQNLPHVVLAVIDQVTSGFLPLARLLDFSRYLLLVLFPLSVFWAMRRFDFDYLAAGFSASIASLLSTFGLYGFNYGSYVWWGFGLYTQLWVMFFLPPALAEIYRAVRNEGSWFWPVFLSAIVLLCHLIYGVILIGSAVIVVFLSPHKAEILSRLRRLAAIFILTALAACYFYLPIILDRAYLYRTIWLGDIKYNSFGAAEVLGNLFSGNLFDYGRLPVLTVLFFLAAVFVLTQWKKEQYRFVLVITFFWLVVYFGRPTWGGLLDLIPLSQNLLFHRFIGGFHLGAILLTGAGLSVCWQWLKNCSFRGISLKSPLAAAIVFLLVLSPAFLGMAQFYGENTRMKTETRDAFLAKSSEISAIKETLDNLPPGRVYAGIYTDFGNYPYYTIGSVPLYFVLPQMGIDTFSYAYTGFGLSTDVRLRFDNTKPEQYNLFNIRYVILHNTWTAPDYYTRIRQFDDYTLYQVPTTGYFDLVDVPAVFYGNSTAFYYPNARWLSSDLPGQKQHPVIELDTGPADSHGLPVFSYDEADAANLSALSRVQPAAGEILNETVSTNGYRARFVAGRECYLMLKTNYAPNWAVTLDGKEVSPVMLAPGFIGINVGPGTHEAVFTYRPQSFRLPLLVTGILVLVLLGLYASGIFNKRCLDLWKSIRKNVQQASEALTRAVRQIPGMMDDNLKKVITITVLVKITIFIIIIFAYFMLLFNTYTYHANFVYPPQEPVNLFTVFKTWDGQHYLYLAENGYPGGVITTSTAFYPLYPFLISLAGALLLGNTLAAALLISNLCSLLAIVYFYQLVKKRYTESIAFTASLCMLSFVTFFYTSLVYSEGLFLLLVIAFFYYLDEKNFTACLFLSILIPLARPTGILVMVPLLGYLVMDYRNNGTVKEPKKYLLPAGFVAGFLFYLVIIAAFTGSFFSGFEAQTLFGAHNSLGNLFDPAAWFLRNFVDIQYTFNGFTTSILNRIFFVLFLVLLWFVYRYLDTTLFLYSLVMGLVPALSDSFMSYIRFLLVIFPVFIALAIRFQKNPYVIIIPSAILQVLLLVAHSLNYWVA